jgi:hypothetical protein
MRNRQISIKRFVLCLLPALLLAIGGCEKEKPPEGLIPVPEMIEIVKDIHLAGAIVFKKDANNKDRSAYREMLYEEIFKSRNVDKEAFLISYDYYLDHPDQMKLIYDQMIEELNERIPTEQLRMQKLK